VLWWTCQLLLWRTHPWPHRDGAGPGIVKGGPRRGAPAVVTAIFTRATGAVVLTFSLPLPLPLPLVLTLAFAAVVGVRVEGGGATGGHSGSCCGGRGGSC
jgi:hypothetical protein